MLWVVLVFAQESCWAARGNEVSLVQLADSGEFGLFIFFFFLLFQGWVIHILFCWPGNAHHISGI